MPLLPLHQHDLGHHQRGDEDHHHLRVHCLVTPVLDVQTLVLHPGGKAVAANTQLEAPETRTRGTLRGESRCAAAFAHFQFSLWVIFSSSWIRGWDRNSGRGVDLTGQFSTWHGTDQRRQLKVTQRVPCLCHVKPLVLGYS